MLRFFFNELKPTQKCANVSSVPFVNLHRGQTSSYGLLVAYAF